MVRAGLAVASSPAGDRFFTTGCMEVLRACDTLVGGRVRASSFLPHLVWQPAGLSPEPPHPALRATFSPLGRRGEPAALFAVG